MSCIGTCPALGQWWYLSRGYILSRVASSSERIFNAENDQASYAANQKAFDRDNANLHFQAKKVNFYSYCLSLH